MPPPYIARAYTYCQIEQKSLNYYPGIITITHQNLAIILQQFNYGNILMHFVRCSVSFQVDIFVLASKD